MFPFNCFLLQWNGNLQWKLPLIAIVSLTQNGQGWKWPCCVWVLNALKCLNYEKIWKISIQYSYIWILDVLIWKILYLSADMFFYDLQKVPEKQEQNLPLASLYRINFLLTICIFSVAAMLTMPTLVTPTLSGGRTETVGQIGKFKAILRREWAGFKGRLSWD